MPRIYIPADRITGDEVFLEARETRHIVKALRLGPGDEVTVFNGEGDEYVAQLSEDEQKGVTLLIKEAFRPEREAPFEITLGQGLLKGEKMKFVIQKATELGPATIVPLVSARSIPTVEEERESLRLQRWQRIAQEAARQCGRAVVPQVERFMTLEEVLSESVGGGLVLWEAEPTPLREVLPQIDASLGLTILIGPEGGFSEDEVSVAQGRGYLVAGLGRRILRAETAALSVLSIIQHRFGDLG